MLHAGGMTTSRTLLGLSLRLICTVGLICFRSELVATATCGCSSSASVQDSSQMSGVPQSSSPTTEQLGTGAVRLIDGDILVSYQQLLQLQQNDSAISEVFSAATQASPYWPNGTLLYSLSTEYTAAEADFIAASLRELQLAVGNAVTFQKVTPGSQVIDYVSVTSGVGCNSYVGKQGGAQALSLQRSLCLQRYIVQHEFIHALGYWHEQSRADRAGYVNIWWGYIDSTKCANFGIFGSTPPAGYPSYDSSSIMHYDSFAFTCDGTSATITSKTTGLITYPTRLATSDLLRIHYYYGPGDNTTGFTQSAAGSVHGSRISRLWILAGAALSVCAAMEHFPLRDNLL